MSTYRPFVSPASGLSFLLAFLVIAFPTSGRAETDPAVGRWKPNLAKSKYASGTGVNALGERLSSFAVFEDSSTPTFPFASRPGVVDPRREGPREAIVGDRL